MEKIKYKFKGITRNCKGLIVTYIKSVIEKPTKWDKFWGVRIIENGKIKHVLFPYMENERPTYYPSKKFISDEELNNLMY